MLSAYDMTEDQQRGVDRLFNFDETLLVANMGAGKTVVALTAIQELMAQGLLGRVLVVAPLKVCNNVWPQEPGQWSHLNGLSVVSAAGKNVQSRIDAIQSGAQVVCINFENLAWFCRTYKGCDQFDGLVVDELTKLKNVGGTGFKALRPHLPKFTWRVGMTGTPVSENWQGLFGQMLVVDAGKRLGTRKDGHLRKYFYPTDYQEYNWALYDWAAAAIAKAVADVVYTIPDYRGQLPALDDQPLPTPLPPALRSVYDRLKKDMVVELEGGEGVTADTAAVLSNKLMQCANGFLYGPATPEGKRGEPIYFDDYKIHTCAREIDFLLVSNRAVIVCYWFEADYRRLIELYPGCELTGANIEKWNRGDLDVLLLHPKSAGHGLNLASGGADMIWLGPIWSRDLREQTIARLWRRPQRKQVRVRTLIGVDTIDELVSAREAGKAQYEELFKHHIGGDLALG